MAPTTLAMSRGPPPSGVIVNFIAGLTGTVPQVPRRGTCQCVRAGFVLRKHRSGARAGWLRDGVQGWRGSSSEGLARWRAGVGVLEPVEAGGGVGGPGPAAGAGGGPRGGGPGAPPGSIHAPSRKRVRRWSMRLNRLSSPALVPTPREAPSSAVAKRAGSCSAHNTGIRLRSATPLGPMTAPQHCST